MIAFAQAGHGTIAGNVFDAQSEQPVRAGTVTAVGATTLSTPVNADGTFKLTAPAGKYKLQF